MSNETEFVRYVLEQLEPQNEVIAKRMFGGHGLFREELMFGLIADNQLYLKADDQSAPQFTAAGCEPFQYQKKEKTFSLSYYLAPEDYFEEISQAQQWADLAFEAALRAAKKKAAKKAKKPKMKAEKITSKISVKSNQR